MSEPGLHRLSGLKGLTFKLTVNPFNPLNLCNPGSDNSRRHINTTPVANLDTPKS
jgi:hypothetical protein